MMYRPTLFIYVTLLTAAASHQEDPPPIWVTAFRRMDRDLYWLRNTCDEILSWLDTSFNDAFMRYWPFDRDEFTHRDIFIGVGLVDLLLQSCALSSILRSVSLHMSGHQLFPPRTRVM